MRLWPLWLLFGITLAGCDGAANAGNTASSAQDSVVAGPAPPASVSAGALALYPQLDNNDAKLVIGEPLDSLERLYPRPTKHTVSTPLPKGFSPEDYIAKGWELGDSTAGAGIISNAQTKETVLALVRQSAANAKAAQDVVDAYKSKIGRPPIAVTYGDFTYTFWEDGDNRLMILEAPGKGDKVQLTLALGAKSLMDYLHADLNHARLDSAASVTPLPATNSASSGP
ncbi:MAG: hypothetical protein ACYC96_02530 [Fimbriimonadaceae bacterium]